MPLKKSTFERPPAAPVFKPSLKEFDDPLTYIEEIRPIAQQYGICKIISPKQWNPPFAVDHNTFKFRPRVQKLNEVGAHSRIKNNFIKSIEAYWEYQGSPLIIPVIRGFQIDLFELHTKVRSYGGSHQVTKNKQWTMVCRELGMGDKAKVISSQVKASYEKLIQPYLDFHDNKFMSDNKELFPDDVAPLTTRGKTATTLSSPKMTRSKTQRFKTQVPTSCKVCESLKDEASMVICEECNLKFHINCLDPPLSDVISPWICSRCLQVNCARELSRLDAEVFGFAQSTCKYSLESFATFADNFKKTYFNNRQNVSLKEVEEEYWRLVAAENSTEDVIVKYGADISSGQTSSGFPTKANRHLFSESDQKYIDSGWNLNNLPILAKSIFRFVSNDISGMTVPWCYVGMVFSCFCWHIEDHWSYSINYMHTGDCKTWYGVPESDADLFEDLMRREAGQLFEKSPDLLHHITTQINPTLLLKNNIKVYRTDQAPGEFIVTFPRAYHAGFNQGFNFAEAVNFCPADWLTKGRASVESYRLVKRPSVFSHNELICKMASAMDTLDIVLLKAVFDEMVIIQQQEKASRKSICTLAHGTCRTERLQLDQITEDERECLYCRTTLYMSGVTCTVCCKNERMVCLDHVQSVCTCATMDNIVLKYRYSLDEISSLVASVKNKLEQYNLWMTRIYHLAKSEFCSSPVSVEEGRVMKNVSKYVESLGVLREDDFSAKCVEEKPNLEELKMLLQLGRKMNYPELLLDFLEAIIDTCQRAMTMTDQLLRCHRTAVHEEDKENAENVKAGDSKLKKDKDNMSPKIATRYEDHNDKLSLSEMRMLVEKLRSLPAHVPQLEEAAQTLNSINEWRKKVKRVVSTNDVVSETLLLELIESGESNLVYLSEYQMLQKMRVHAVWVAAARTLIGCTDRCALPTLLQCKKMRDEGLVLINTIEIDRIATLNESLDVEEDEETMNGDDDLSDYRRTGWNLVVSNLKDYERQLSALIAKGDSMQKEADDILRSTPGVYTLNALKMLLKGAEKKLNCVVSGIERLKEVLNDAVTVNSSITEMWQKLQLTRRLVHINEMQALIKQADSLCVSFDYLAEIKALNNTVESWKKNLHSLFIKSSHNTYLMTPALLEVLFPRPIRMFKLMIARESVSSKLVMACKAESTLKKEDVIKEDVESGDEDKQSDDHKPVRNRAPRKNRGRQKRTSFSADDPQVARRDNVIEFEAFLKSASSIVDLDGFNVTYRSMCINELEWMWNLRELNEDKANKDSSGHDVYCFCRKRGIDQKGAQVMCDLCQDWFHSACLGIQNKDMSKKKFLCPQCERSKRPAFEVILAEKRKIEQEAKMLKIPEHMVLCLMSQRVISFHKHTNQLFSPQTELGAVFAEYKKLFGVQAILPKASVSSQQDLSPLHDQQTMDTPLAHLASGKQSRKTPHSMAKSGQPSVTTAVPVPLSPVPSKETLMNIRRLRSSLSDDARRELEEIYIELCLLEVTQPTVTWIWKLYHSLIDDEDEDVVDEATGGEKHAVTTKKEHSLDPTSEYSMDRAGAGPMDKAINPGLDYLCKVAPSKTSKRMKMYDRDDDDNDNDDDGGGGDGANQGDYAVKRECLPSTDDRRDPTEKFSFKRKLAAKNAGPTHIQVKKQSTVKVPPPSSSRSTVTRKRGRGGRKRSAGYRDVWEGNPGISSEYYDEENDVILLDNVEITRQHRAKARRVKRQSAGSVKSASEDSGPGSRQQRSQRLYQKQVSGEKSDYSDENSPSQVKRGRKASTTGTTALAQEVTPGTSTTAKRRKRATTGGSKRVCNDDCAAHECVQQSSDKVNWIACDVCNQWYHWFCVGIKSEVEIDDRFLCPSCKDPKKQNRLPNYKDILMSSLDDEVTEDIETDDLNVILDDQVTAELVDMASLTRIPSSTGSGDMTMRRTSSQVDDQSTSQNVDAYFHGISSSSPQPPFLQPECCVQEEVVEISYVSRSDSD